MDKDELLESAEVVRHRQGFGGLWRMGPPSAQQRPLGLWRAWAELQQAVAAAAEEGEESGVT